jgi:VWFA-related protein
VHSIYLVDGKSVTAGARRADAGGLGEVHADERPALATPAAPPRVFVLYFDQDHLDGNGFQRLQAAAVEFLQNQFQPGDVGGVLVGATMVGNRLTVDREALVQAVRGAKFAQRQVVRKLDLLEWPRMSEVEATRIAVVNDRDVLQQVVRRAERDAPGSGGGGRGAAGPDYEVFVRNKASQIVSELRPAAARTVQTLLVLLNGLARIPGRKTVVFMTDGFWVEESWGQLRQIVGLAARANVRFYSLDAQGLRRGSSSTGLNQMNPMETSTALPTGAYNSIEDGPNSIAWDTGGYYIRNTNDFKGALTEIATDTSTYYVLGYTPADTTLDGRYRQVSVRVKRDGVTVRARRGYVASAAASTLLSGPPAAPQPKQAVPEGAATALPGALPIPAAAGAPGATPAPPSADAPASGSPAAPRAIELRPDSSARIRELAAGAGDAGTVKALASQGWDRYGNGDLEGAERLLTQAVGQGAAPWVSYALGFAQVGLKRPLEAVQSWERVRAAAPTFEPVYLDLADLYVQLNDQDKAVETLRAAEKRWPADVDVLNALGTVQVRRNALEDAITTFERAAKADPKDPLAFFNLGRTCELRYFAMRRFSRPTSRWVDNPELLNKAIENYEVCTRLGGPYEADARAAIDRLRNIR